jgi:2-iminobutanoate/2-iminopropanoate deaminase
MPGDIALTNPATMAAPGGQYSHAVAAGGFVFVSGQLPIAPDGTKLTDAPFERQAQQVLGNIAAALVAAGSSVGRLVQVRVYVTDIQSWPAFNTLYAAWRERRGRRARSYRCRSCILDSRSRRKPSPFMAADSLSGPAARRRGGDNVTSGSSASDSVAAHPISNSGWRRGTLPSEDRRRHVAVTGRHQYGADDHASDVRQTLRAILFAGILTSFAGLDLDMVRADPAIWRREWPRTDFSKHTVPLGEIKSGGPPKDGIPSIDGPRFERYSPRRHCPEMGGGTGVCAR